MIKHIREIQRNLCEQAATVSQTIPMDETVTQCV